MRYAHDVYQRNAVTTATPGQILLSLFDGALRFTAQARQAIVDKKPQVKGENISRALNILTELASTLDDRYAPDLCDQLRSLYAYYARRLRDGSSQQDTAPLDEVTRHLQDLRDTWAQAIHMAQEETR